MRQIIRIRSQTYTVTRPGAEGSKSAMGEEITDTSTVDVDALLYSPREDEQPTDFGNRVTGDLNGLALPSADVQVEDVYAHGSDDYVVTDVTHVPSDENKTLKQFALDMKVNP